MITVACVIQHFIIQEEYLELIFTSILLAADNALLAADMFYHLLTCFTSYRHAFRAACVIAMQHLIQEEYSKQMSTRLPRTHYKQHTKWPGDIRWGAEVEAAGGECRSAIGSSSTLHPYDSPHRCGDVFRCRCSCACLIGGAGVRVEYCVLMFVRVYV